MPRAGAEHPAGPAQRLELPYDFPTRDYEQILTDFVTRIATVLGWRPAQAA